MSTKAASSLRFSPGFDSSFIRFIISARFGARFMKLIFPSS
jgi:hypothetical protein